MRLLQNWMAALAGVVFLHGAAFADVTVSQSNDPKAVIGDRVAALIGIEKSAALHLDVAPVAKRAGKPAAKAKGSAGPTVVRYDTGYLAGLPKATGDQQWECLAKALYFESRGETVKGQFAVAEVILNRADSPRYPASICSVVHQGSKKGCQFSFTCDRHPDKIREQAAWVQAGKIARLMIDGAPRALTQGATHFHTGAVRPAWARKFPKTAQIGSHLFYRQPGAGT